MSHAETKEVTYLDGHRIEVSGCAYALLALAALGVTLVLAVAWRAATWALGL